MTEDHSVVLFFIFLFIIGFLFFQPNIRSAFFANSSEVKKLEENILNRKYVDEQLFWQTREFYSPGVLTFNKEGLENNTVQELLDKGGVNINPLSYYHSFLRYKSDKWESVEFLVKSNQLNKIMAVPNGHILLNDKNIILDQIDEKKHLLIFLKPVVEMEKANGYFDYKQWDKELLKDKYWLTISIITI